MGWFDPGLCNPVGGCPMPASVGHDDACLAKPSLALAKKFTALIPVEAPQHPLVETTVDHRISQRLRFFVGHRPDQAVT